MKISKRKFLGTVHLICTTASMFFGGILGDSGYCEAGCVYNYISNTCIKVFDWYTRHYDDPYICKLLKGGEYRNESGVVARVDHDNTAFFKDYLRYLRLPRAAIHLTEGSRISQHFLDYEDFMHLRCRGYDKFWRRRNHNIQLISLAEALGTPLDWEDLPPRYDGPILCQADSAGAVPEESSCPSNLTVKSVSDDNVTLNIVPGETKTQVKIRFSVYNACNNTVTSCRTFLNRLEKKIFLVKPATHTFVDLESSTRFTAHFVIDSKDGRFFECNETIDFTTNGGVYLHEKFNLDENKIFYGLIFGLVAVLACSLCAIAVLSICYCRMRNKINGGDSRVSPVPLVSTKAEKNARSRTDTAQDTANAYTISFSGPATTTINIDKCNRVQDKDNNSQVGDYTNLQTANNNYDEINDERDDHVYEVQ